MEYDFVKNRFPETMDNVNQRVKMVQGQFMSALKQANFENEKKTPEKVAYLYFTHGTLLQQFSALNEEDCKQEWAKYCSISALEVGLNKLGSEVEKALVLDLHNDN